jgi:uncharacterized protein (DUF433 family)
MKAIKTLKLPKRKSRVARHPEILGGKPVIAGTRIPVRLILDHLAEGYMPEEIIIEYPVLTRADIRAALRFASRAIEKIENGKGDTILDVKNHWGRRHGSRHSSGNFTSQGNWRVGIITQSILTKEILSCCE